MALRHAGCGSTISQPCFFAPLVILSTIFLSTLRALPNVLASSCTVLTGLADNPGTGAGDSDLGDEYPLSCKTTVIAVSCQKTGRKDGGARRDRTDDLLLAKPLKTVTIALKSVKNRRFFCQIGRHSEPLYARKRYGWVRLAKRYG